MSRRLHGNPDKGYAPIRPSFKPDGFVYVAHFDQPIGSDKHQASHYIGKARDVEARNKVERKGGPDAPRIFQVLKERGIGFETVKVWPGNSYVENALKSYGSAKPMCPRCTNEPKVPRIVQRVIKTYERQQYRAARKADKAEKEQANREKAGMPKGPHTKAERFSQGARAGASFVQALMTSGKSADQIEAAHLAVTSEAAPRDEKGEVEASGWNMQVDSDLDLLRQAEREYEERQHELTPIERTQADEPYVRQLTTLADKEADFSWLPDEYRQPEYQEPQYQEREAV